MFAGHLGAAFAIGRVERGLNIGVFIAAALLLDFLLWLFVLVGWESVAIPADFMDTHQPEFVFPYSHGLLASVFWSCLAAAVVFVLCSHLRRKWRAAALVALAVLSHWVLDVLVHRPELPLAGPGSHPIGLHLWGRMSFALGLEAALVAVGLYLFIDSSKIARGKAVSLVALSAVVMVFTAVGMTVAPPPPSATTMAVSSLGTLVLVCALACWYGTPSQQT